MTRWNNSCRLLLLTVAATTMMHKIMESTKHGIQPDLHSDCKVVQPSPCREV